MVPSLTAIDAKLLVSQSILAGTGRRVGKKGHLAEARAARANAHCRRPPWPDQSCGCGTGGLLRS